MKRLEITNTPTPVIFPPVTVAQVTTTGLENWRTLVRTPPAWGITCVSRPPIPPTLIGMTQREQQTLNQRTSPQGVYVPLSKIGG